MYMDQKINIKIAILSKLIYRFNVIPIKIPIAFFAESLLIIKFMWNARDPE